MKEPFKPAEKQNRLLQDKARKKKKCKKAPFFAFFCFLFLQEEMSEGQHLRWGMTEGVHTAGWVQEGNGSCHATNAAALTLGAMFNFSQPRAERK